MLKILSINMHGVPFVAKRKPERMKAISEKVKREKYDIVLFQEIWLMKHAKQLVELLNFEYNPVYPINKMAIGFEWFGLRKGGLLAFVKKETLGEATNNFEEFKKSSPWWRVWEGDGIARKGVQFFKLKYSRYKGLMIYNTHLQAEYKKNSYPDILASQVKQIRELIKNEKEVLFAGDMNIRRYDSLFSELSEGMEDMTLTKEKNDFINPRGQIDFIFYKGKKFIKDSVDIIKKIKKDVPYTDHDGYSLTIKTK